MNGVAARSTAHELSRVRRRASFGRVAARVAVYAVATGAALVSAAPFLWGLVTALAHDRRGRTGRIRLGPPPTTEHVRSLLHSTSFPAFVVNTLVVGSVVVAITLTLALPAAYALARLNPLWGPRIAIAVLLACLVPPSLLLLSLSRVVAMLGLADSAWSLVLVYPVVTVPISIWLLFAFIRAVPPDVEEQAMVDGHSRLGAFVRVVVPPALPGIAAVAVLAFTLAAGEFTYALTLVWSSERMPVGTGLVARPPGDDPVLWQSVSAGVVLVAVPVALACNVVLDRLVGGMVRSRQESVKVGSRRVSER
jgi:multiple sugar transport system permease protein